MELKSWKSSKMAAAVSALAPSQPKVSRQNIENLLRGEVDVPRYIKPLAKLMGLTVHQLLGGIAIDGSAMLPPAQIPAPVVRPVRQYSARSLDIADTFDEATRGMSSYHRALIDAAIIQVIENLTQPGALPELPQIDTHA